MLECAHGCAVLPAVLPLVPHPVVNVLCTQYMVPHGATWYHTIEHLMFPDDLNTQTSNAPHTGTHTWHQSNKESDVP